MKPLCILVLFTLSLVGCSALLDVEYNNKITIPAVLNSVAKVNGSLILASSIGPFVDEVNTAWTQYSQYILEVTSPIGQKQQRILPAPIDNITYNANDDALFICSKDGMVYRWDDVGSINSMYALFNLSDYVRRISNYQSEYFNNWDRFAISCLYDHIYKRMYIAWRHQLYGGASNSYIRFCQYNNVGRTALHEDDVKCIKQQVGGPTYGGEFGDEFKSYPQQLFTPPVLYGGAVDYTRGYAWLGFMSIAPEGIYTAGFLRLPLNETVDTVNTYYDKGPPVIGTEDSVPIAFVKNIATSRTGNQIPNFVGFSKTGDFYMSLVNEYESTLSKVINPNGRLFSVSQTQYFDFFSPGGSDQEGAGVYAGIMDSLNTFMYFVSNRGGIFRYNTVTGQASTTIIPGVRLTAVNIDPDDYYLYVVHANISLNAGHLSGNYSDIYPVQIIDCTPHTTCSSCQAADPYCAWCEDTATCDHYSQCKGTPLKDTCPTFTGVAPMRTPYTGGGVLTFQGTFVPDNEDLKCTFSGGVEVNATYVGPNSVTCVAPEHVIGTVDTNMRIGTRSELYTTPVPLEFYNCASAQDCTTCGVLSSSNQGCHWCVNTGSCSFESECPVGPYNTGTCPTIAMGSTIFGSTVGNTTITITSTAYPTTTDTYECLFTTSAGNVVAKTPAVKSGSEVSCNTPPYGVAESVNVGIVRNNATFTANTVSFTYYNCASQTSCDTCHSAVRPECVWCLGTASCGTASQCPTLAVEEVQCPAVTATQSFRGYIGGNTSISFGVAPLAAVSGYSCVFTTSSNVRFATTTATVVNNNITCLSPAGFAGDASVRVEINGNSYMPDTVAFTYYDCSATTCDTCQDDCRWCFTSTSSSKCSGPSSCSDGIFTSGVCPVIPPKVGGESYSFSGSATGGTTITFPVTFLPASSDYKCLFTAANLRATINATVANGNITCVSPVASGNTIANIAVLLGDEAFAPAAATFNYYECNVPNGNCSTCYSAQRSECRWCFDQGSCGGIGACTGVSTTTTCPATTGPVLSFRGSKSGSTSITFPLSYIAPTTGYQCIFAVGGLDYSKSDATTSGNDVTCLSPPYTLALTSELSASVRVDLKDHPYSGTAANFTYYDCAASPTCGTCYSAQKSECSWCLGSQTCGGVGACSGQAVVGNCPVFTTTITPTRGSVSGNTNITFNVAPLEITTGYQCAFDFVGFQRRFTTAVVSSPTTVWCPTAPSPQVGGGTASVSLHLQSKEYTNSTLSFTYYDCASSQACETCFSSDFSECQWCYATAVCGGLGTCSTTSSLDTPSCPRVSGLTAQTVNGNAGSTDGGTPIIITGSGFNVLSNSTSTKRATNPVQCKFGDYSTDALVTSDTTLECVTPHIPIEGNYTLQVMYLGKVFAESSQVFSYYDCGRQFTCPTCYAANRPECNWCLEDQTCGGVGTCAGLTAQSTCPTLSNFVGQTTGAVDGGSTLTVRGTLFIATAADKDSLKCNFDGVETTATTVNQTHLTCPTPAHSGGPSLVRISYKNALYNTGNPLSFFYYECSLSTSCATCYDPTARAECSWCLHSQKCGVASKCDGTPAQVCPVLSSLGTASGASYGNTTVTIAATGLIDDVDMYCRFNNTIDTPVVELTNTSAVCASPKVTGSGSVPVTLIYDGVQYAAQNLQYTYYDCASFATCGDCTAVGHPECGFCLNTQTCGVGAQCSNAYFSSACPALTRISPVSGPTGGDFTVTVVGNSFIAGIECVFGDKKVASTFVDSTTILCPAPALTSFDASQPSTNVPLTLVYGNVTYVAASNFIYLTPTAPGAVVGDNANSVIVPAVVPSVIAVLAIAAVVGFLLINKRRQKALLEKYSPPALTEERMAALVYGATPALSRDDRKFATSLEFFESLLLAPDMELVGAIGDVTDSSEADNISKALVFLFSAAGEDKVCTLIQNIASREIKLSQHQSTLFRTNSVATKLYRIYSRMIGLPWLHTAVGFELNRILQKPANFEMDTKKFTQEDDEILNKFSLNTDCQKLLVQIIRNADKVPSPFKRIFGRALGEIRAKFVLEQATLASVIQDNLATEVQQLKTTLQDNSLDADKIDELTSLLHTPSSPDGLAAMQPRVEGLQAVQDAYNTGISRIMAAYDDLSAALNPTGDAAQKLLKKHQATQNCVVVGGFFFLRFVGPAITNPETYGLVRDNPSDEARRLLILIAKVLQNLSNGITFGGKEAHMAKMNDFILSNKENMQQLFVKLSDTNGIDMSKTESTDKPLNIPPEHKELALLVLYQLVVDKLPKLLNNLNSVREGEDTSSTQRRAQVAQALDHFMKNSEHTPPTTVKYTYAAFKGGNAPTSSSSKKPVSAASSANIKVGQV